MGSATCSSGTARPEPEGVGEVVDVDRDEAVVLEPAEDAEQRGRPRPPWPMRRVRSSCVARDTQAPPTKAMTGGAEQEEAVAPAHPAVEDVAQRRSWRASTAPRRG